MGYGKQKRDYSKNGALLSFRLSATFGGGAVIIDLNPSHEDKGQKKYLMWWGESAVKARAKSPFMSSDKAKSIAAWAADRDAHWAF